MININIKIRQNPLNEDLAFRFQISNGKLSQIFITWIKLLLKELTVLVIWLSRSQTRATLTEGFKKLFPKTRTIIYCGEVFMDTPNSLDVQVCLWTTYIHYCTITFLACTTPNGRFLGFPQFMVEGARTFILPDIPDFLIFWGFSTTSWQTEDSKSKLICH